MKFFDILTTGTRNLLQSKVRTTLTILAVFIGAFSISLTIALNTGISEFLEQELGALGAENVLQVWRGDDATIQIAIGSESGEPILFSEEEMNLEFITETDLEAIRALPNIESAEAFNSIQISNIRSVDGERYNFSAVPAIPYLNVNLIDGRYVDLDSEGRELVIDEPFVEVLGFTSVEDAIGQDAIIQVLRPDGELIDLEVVIVGVQYPNVMLGGNSSGWINRALQEEILAINTEGLPEAMVNQVRFAEVVVADKEQLPAVQEALADLGFASLTLEDQISGFMGVVNAISGGIIVFGAIALLAAVFGIINTLYMSVGERTREIGLMKALGLGRRKIFFIFCWEASMIGFFGSFLGLIAAMGMGAMINPLATETFLSGMPGLELTSFNLVSSMVIIVMIMFIAFLAGTLPARRASKLDPITALRTE